MLIPDELEKRKAQLWADIKVLTDQFKVDTELEVVIDKRHVQYWETLENIMPF